MAKTRIAGVRNAHGATQIIHGVDIDVADGALVIPVGPSGRREPAWPRMIGCWKTRGRGARPVARRGGQERPCVFRDRIDAHPRRNHPRHTRHRRDECV